MLRAGCKFTNRRSPKHSSRRWPLKNALKPSVWVFKVQHTGLRSNDPFKVAREINSVPISNHHINLHRGAVIRSSRVRKRCQSGIIGHSRQDSLWVAIHSFRVVPFDVSGSSHTRVRGSVEGHLSGTGNIDLAARRFRIFSRLARQPDSKNRSAAEFAFY